MGILACRIKPVPPASLAVTSGRRDRMEVDCGSFHSSLKYGCSLSPFFFFSILLPRAPSKPQQLPTPSTGRSPALEEAVKQGYKRSNVLLFDHGYCGDLFSLQANLILTNCEASWLDLEG